jgi:hypothetical protein
MAAPHACEEESHRSSHGAPAHLVKRTAEQPGLAVRAAGRTQRPQHLVAVAVAAAEVVVAAALTVEEVAMAPVEVPPVEEVA